MTEKLIEYFPKDRFKIVEETDKTVIKMLLNSTSSHTWGQGDIGTTGYYQLSRFTETVNNFNVVIVCKKNLIQ